MYVPEKGGGRGYAVVSVISGVRHYGRFDGWGQTIASRMSDIDKVNLPFMERTNTVDVLRCAMEDSGAQCVGRMSPMTWPLLHVVCWDLVLKVKRRNCVHICT